MTLSRDTVAGRVRKAPGTRPRRPRKGASAYDLDPLITQALICQL